MKTEEASEEDEVSDERLSMGEGADKNKKYKMVLNSRLKPSSPEVKGTEFDLHQADAIKDFKVKTPHIKLKY